MKSHCLTWFGLFSLLLVSPKLLAQSEQFFRHLKEGKLLKKDKDSGLGQDKVIVETPIYQYDLDGDGFFENIVYQKIDGRDALRIYDYRMQLIKKIELQAYGLESRLYKIEFSKLSKQISTLIIHFYEGINKGVNALATGRVYFLTWSEGQMEKMSLFKGPGIWLEQQLMDDHYQRRLYKVSVLDYNGDGIRDISVTSNDINRVFIYDQKKASWRKW